VAVAVSSFEAFLAGLLNLPRCRLLCQFPHVDIPRIVITLCDDNVEWEDPCEHHGGFLSRVWNPRIEEFGWQYVSYWQRQMEFREADWVEEVIAASAEGREPDHMPDSHVYMVTFNEPLCWDYPVNPDTLMSDYRVQECVPGMAQPAGNDVWWANWGCPYLMDVDGKLQLHSKRQSVSDANNK
jgi:hypothetical protein